ILDVGAHCICARGQVCRRWCHGRIYNPPLQGAAKISGAPVGRAWRVRGSIGDRPLQFNSIAPSGDRGCLFPILGGILMPHELTPQDIEKMQKELDYRRIELMPELLEEVKRTRAFGDLSENYEYKAAKQAQNANRKRIRYLTRMIQNSTVLEDTSAADEVGLFDRVELYFEE